MDKLINKNIGLQNTGLTEIESWGLMLKKAQTKLFNAYNKKDSDSITNNQKDIDFIQKQILRLSQN
jgi:hypothetical protein